MLAEHSLKTKRKYNFKETCDSRYIYKNKLDEACFQYDMADGNFKDLPGTTVGDKVLLEKIFRIAKTPKYDRYQCRLASPAYKFLIKCLLVVVLKVKLSQAKN